MQAANKVDKAAYDVYYQNSLSKLAEAKDKDDYIALYESTNHLPFHDGGKTKSYVRSLSTKAILTKAQAMQRDPGDVTVLD